MRDPLLLVVAGPNGAGKTTFYERVIEPVTHLPFVNADLIDLLREAATAGFRVHLHVVTVPVELAVARVTNRVAQGGHPVPEDKIWERYDRLAALDARPVASRRRLTLGPIPPESDITRIIGIVHGVPCNRRFFDIRLADEHMFV